MPAQQQFRVAINRREDIAISAGFGVLAESFGRLSLTSDKRPLLVAFNRIYDTIRNCRFHESAARFASLNHQTKDRIAMNSGESFTGSNRHSFEEHPQDFRRLFDASFLSGGGVWFSERLCTGCATESLKSVAIFSELSGILPTGWTLHLIRLFLLANRVRMFLATEHSGDSLD